MDGEVPAYTGVPAMDVVIHDENHRMMRTLASVLGDLPTARKLLAEENIDISTERLQMLRRGELRPIYETYAKELAPRLEEQLVADMREIAARASQMEHAIMDDIIKKLPSMADPARALTAVTKCKQVAIEKVLALTGRPSVITERRDAAQLVRKLEAMRVLVPIESTAEEE